MPYQPPKGQDGIPSIESFFAVCSCNNFPSALSRYASWLGTCFGDSRSFARCSDLALCRWILGSANGLGLVNGIDYYSSFLELLYSLLKWVTEPEISWRRDLQSILLFRFVQMTLLFSQILILGLYPVSTVQSSSGKMVGHTVDGRMVAELQTPLDYRELPSRAGLLDFSH